MDDKVKIDKEEKEIEEIEEDLKQEEVKEENKTDDSEKLKKRIEELEDQVKRAVADYRNLERRSIEERRDAVKFANKELILSLLPAIDILILAQKFTTDENVKLTVAKITEILKENGIEKVETNGAKYNADTMEAIEVLGEGDAVIEEVGAGFILNGKLIRPAQVKVGGADQK